MTDTMRALFCGDREWSDYEMVRSKLAYLREAFPKVEICHGDCRGADRIAGTAAQSLSIPVTAYPADWKRHGKGAGPIRNRLMLRYFAPEIVYAFHDNLDASKGTADMVKIARAAGIQVVHCFHERGHSEPLAGLPNE